MKFKFRKFIKLFLQWYINVAYILNILKTILELFVVNFLWYNNLLTDALISSKYYEISVIYYLMSLKYYEIIIDYIISSIYNTGLFSSNIICLIYIYIYIYIYICLFMV